MNNVSFVNPLRALLALVLLFSLFQACKKDDSPTVTPTNTTSLRARLDSANTMYNAATEGSAIGSYESGSKATYKTAIDNATSVLNNTASTQTQINNAYVNLGQAMATFQSKRVAEIAPSNLVLLLHLDNNLLDASGRGFSGSAVAGASGVGSATATGGGSLSLTTDRLGRAEKAYLFDRGAHIEIPYNSVLNPAKEITIAMWIKPTVVRANNYILSLGRWFGYKLNLQEANKVFMTVNTGGGKIIDKDNESPTLDINKWYHIAVSYKSGEMVFYIDGTPVKTWTDVSGDPVAVKSNVGLSIGQDLPNALYTGNVTDANGYNFFGEWGGYFTGAMDEIRIYNTVLSSTQVRSIYNAEKSQ